LIDQIFSALLKVNNILKKRNTNAEKDFLLLM